MGGLATTFTVLGRTANEAALAVLLPALDAAAPTVQDAALTAILKRRNPTGLPEILRRVPFLSLRWQAIIRRHPGKLTRAIRDAILGSDEAMCRKGCQAAVWFSEYDLVPVLLQAMEEGTGPNTELAASTLMKLVEQLSDELSGKREPEGRRDPQTVRTHVLGALELSLRRYSKHKRREVLEGVLLLASRENQALNSILQNPHHVAFVPLVEMLRTSEHPVIVRLLLSYLDDPKAPSAVLAVAGNRSDIRFVRHLLRKIGREPATAVEQNLRRIESIPWLRQGQSFFDQLDDAGQHSLVCLAMHTGIPRAQAFSVVGALLVHGNVGGRRAAAQALAEFPGADANALALRAMADSDPHVQAHIVRQLRRRGIPGVLPKLVAMIDSRHSVVRAAARQSLSEFTFTRFASAFDMLDDEVRQSTAELVRKIDPQTVPLLRQELQSPSRARRLRGLDMARTMALVGQLEAQVIALLNDDDHMIRNRAAECLAHSASNDARAALRHALSDQSTAVQEMARRSLDQDKEFARWREMLADPRD
ncbi:MAG: HEAT repeat domain-containing protein [Planctomycetota bacterium]